MKNPAAYMRSNTPSSFWVSRDYGKSFTEISKNFTLPNGTRAVITEFYSSKANHEYYILVDKFHKYIYSSSDECRTFRRVRVYFHPVEIKYHPYYYSYVLAYEKDMGNKQVLSFVIVFIVGHLLTFLWILKMNGMVHVMFWIKFQIVFQSHVAWVRFLGAHFQKKEYFFACTPEVDVIFAYFCKNSAKVLCNSFTQLGLQ